MSFAKTLVREFVHGSEAHASTIPELSDEVIPRILPASRLTIGVVGLRNAKIRRIDGCDLAIKPIENGGPEVPVYLAVDILGTKVHCVLVTWPPVADSIAYRNLSAGILSI